jgi:hypothetical protein
MKKIQVGLSIAFGQQDPAADSEWHQSIAFMVLVLRACPDVGKVFLLNAGTTTQLPAGFGHAFPEVDLLTPQEALFQLDLVIEFGASLPLEWIRHVRALGAKVVAMTAAPPFTEQAEASIFGRRTGTSFIGTPWDEVWMPPHHMKTSAPMLRTLSRVQVSEVPYIWSPHFLDGQCAELGARGLTFGFGQRAADRVETAWRLAIFQPNVSVVQNCFIPMLACDHAYRTNRRAVGLMMVTNAFHMKEHPTFNTLASHLELTRDGKATYEPRLAFAECMTASSIDAVVAHHWECGLSHLYCEALHGGYPLVHNSEFLEAEGVGFYYPGFEAIRAGHVLLDAWAKEPGFWTGYRQRAASYLARLRPDHPENVALLTRRIRSLMGDRLEHHA